MFEKSSDTLLFYHVFDDHLGYCNFPTIERYQTEDIRLQQALQTNPSLFVKHIDNCSLICVQVNQDCWRWSCYDNACNSCRSSFSTWILISCFNCFQQRYGSKYSSPSQLTSATRVPTVINCVNICCLKFGKISTGQLEQKEMVFHQGVTKECCLK